MVCAAAPCYRDGTVARLGDLVRARWTWHGRHFTADGNVVESARARCACGSCGSARALMLATGTEILDIPWSKARRLRAAPEPAVTR